MVLWKGVGAVHCVGDVLSLCDLIVSIPSASCVSPASDMPTLPLLGRRGQQGINISVQTKKKNWSKPPKVTQLWTQICSKAVSASSSHGDFTYTIVCYHSYSLSVSTTSPFSSLSIDLMAALLKHLQTAVMSTFSFC